MRTIALLSVAALVGIVITPLATVMAVGSGAGSGSGLGSGSGNPCGYASCSQECMVTQRGGFQCVCNPGYVLDEDGYTCVVCRRGYYGENCQETCDCGDLGNTCDHVNGSCQCNACWGGPNCSTYESDDCLESYLRAVDKDSLVGLDVPLLPNSTVEVFIADMLQTSRNIVDNLSIRRITRESTRSLLKIEFTLLGSADRASAEDALEELTTMIKSGEWRATCITNTAVDNAQDTDVTLNIQ